MNIIPRLIYILREIPVYVHGKYFQKNSNNTAAELCVIQQSHKHFDVLWFPAPFLHFNGKMTLEAKEATGCSWVASSCFPNDTPNNWHG